MSKDSRNYNSQGLELLKAGRLEVAINFFTKAIEEDPEFLEAYKNRGETLIKLKRVDEGKKDLQRAEGKKKKTVKKKKKQKKVVEKYDYNGVEDIWSSVLSEESSESSDDLFLDDYLDDDDFESDASGIEHGLDTPEEQFDDDTILYEDTYSGFALGDEEDSEIIDEELEDDTIIYDDTYSGIALADEEVSETVVEELEDDADLQEEISEDEVREEELVEEEQVEEEAVPVSSETDTASAQLEYIGGMQQEVTQARLFEPLENSLLIIDEETNDEQVVFFDQLRCLRLSHLPARISGKRKESCTKEIIETVDGETFHELVHHEQDLENILICFSTDDHSSYPVTLIPKSIIRKRTQDKKLTDILLEKRFISKTMLKKAYQEYKQFKSMTLEKVIAQKARIPLVKIEEALDQAQKGHMQGLPKEEILLFSGLVTDGDILAAVEQLENIEKLNIGHFLIQNGLVKETQVYKCLAVKYKIPFVDLKEIKISKKSLATLPKSMITNNEILPLAMKEDTLLVAAPFIDMTHLSEAIVKIAGCKYVKFALSPPSQIRKIITMLFAKKK